MLSKSGQNLDWIEKHGIQARDVHNSTRRMNIGQIVPRLQGMLCIEFLLVRTLIKEIVEFSIMNVKKRQRKWNCWFKKVSLQRFIHFFSIILS